MSTYLTIKKKGVKLCSYSNNSEFYQAFGNFIPCDKWGECSLDDLYYGLNSLEEEIINYKKCVERYKASLHYLKKADDIYEALSSIDSFEESLEETREAFYYVKFLIEVYNQDKGNMEWKIE